MTGETFNPVVNPSVIPPRSQEVGNILVDNLTIENDPLLGLQVKLLGIKVGHIVFGNDAGEVNASVIPLGPNSSFPEQIQSISQALGSLSGNFKLFQYTHPAFKSGIVFVAGSVSSTGYSAIIKLNTEVHANGTGSSISEGVVVSNVYDYRIPIRNHNTNARILTGTGAEVFAKLRYVSGEYVVSLFYLNNAQVETPYAVPIDTAIDLEAILYSKKFSTLPWDAFVLDPKLITRNSTWYNGSSNPINSLGFDGDYYLNNTSKDYFDKVSGAWVLKGNLNGGGSSSGTGWSNGATVPPNTDGLEGDFFLHNPTGYVWLKGASIWAVSFKVEKAWTAVNSAVTLAAESAKLLVNTLVAKTITLPALPTGLQDPIELEFLDASNNGSAGLVSLITGSDKINSTVTGGTVTLDFNAFNFKMRSADASIGWILY